MATYQVRCPACRTENRIPAQKEGIQGRCGTCHHTLPALFVRPVALDETSFDRFFDSYHGLALAEFWAPW